MLKRESPSLKITYLTLKYFFWVPDLSLALSYSWYSFLLPLLLWSLTFTLKMSRTPLFKGNGFCKDWHSLSSSLCLLFPQDSNKSHFTTTQSLPRQQAFLGMLVKKNYPKEHAHLNGEQYFLQSHSLHPSSQPFQSMFPTDSSFSS